MAFGLWMSCPQGSTRGRFRFVGYSNDFHLPKFIFRLLDARKGSPKLAFVNFRPLDGLPARVHQSSHSSIFDFWMLARVHQSSHSSIFDLWMACKGSPKLAFINFRPSDACKGSAKLAFIHFQPLDGLPTRVNQGSLAFINFRPLDGSAGRVHQSSLSSINFSPFVA